MSHFIYFFTYIHTPLHIVPKRSSTWNTDEEFSGNIYSLAPWPNWKWKSLVIIACVLVYFWVNQEVSLFISVLQPLIQKLSRSDGGTHFGFHSSKPNSNQSKQYHNRNRYGRNSRSTNKYGYNRISLVPKDSRWKSRNFWCNKNFQKVNCGQIFRYDILGYDGPN